MGTVLTVNVGEARPNPAKRAPLTGIDKRPTGEPVYVRAPGPKATGLGSGLVGDAVCDQRHHGGDDQAVYAYAREDLDWWQRELGRDLPGGLFGENLTTAGVDASGATIGEVWRVGPEVVLQVTGPRIPCSTFQATMGLHGWIQRFTREARPGAYLRVVTPGHVRAGDPIEVVDRPANGVDVAFSFRAFTLERHLLPTLLAADGIGDGLRAEAEALLVRA